MAGSDPAGRPLRARLGHRQRPQGPSHFWTAATAAGPPQVSRNPRHPKRVSAASGNLGWRRGVERCKVTTGGSAWRGR